MGPWGLWILKFILVMGPWKPRILECIPDVEPWEPWILKGILDVGPWKPRILKCIFDMGPWEPRILKCILDAGPWEPRILNCILDAGPWGSWTLIFCHGTWSRMPFTMGLWSVPIVVLSPQVVLETAPSVFATVQTSRRQCLLVAIPTVFRDDLRDDILNPCPTGGGGYFEPPLVFLRYLLNQCKYHHQTCSTLSPSNSTHCVK